MKSLANKPIEDSEITTGVLLLAQYSDKKWYRAKVLEKGEKAFKISKEEARIKSSQELRNVDKKQKKKKESDLQDIIKQTQLKKAEMRLKKFQESQRPASQTRGDEEDEEDETQSQVGEGSDNENGDDDEDDVPLERKSKSGQSSASRSQTHSRSPLSAYSSTHISKKKTKKKDVREILEDILKRLRVLERSNLSVGLEKNDDGVVVRNLAKNYDSLKVPLDHYTVASAKAGVGEALAELLPHLFTVEELKGGGVTKLNSTKVAGLVAFCTETHKTPLQCRKKPLDMVGSVRKFLSQKCSDALNRGFEFT